jgi:hypothetical protein
MRDGYRRTSANARYRRPRKPSILVVFRLSDYSSPVEADPAIVIDREDGMAD